MCSWSFPKTEHPWGVLKKCFTGEIQGGGARVTWTCSQANVSKGCGIDIVSLSAKCSDSESEKCRGTKWEFTEEIVALVAL